MTKPESRSASSKRSTRQRAQPAKAIKVAAQKSSKGPKSKDTVTSDEDEEQEKSNEEEDAPLGTTKRNTAGRGARSAKSTGKTAPVRGGKSSKKAAAVESESSESEKQDEVEEEEEEDEEEEEEEEESSSEEDDDGSDFEEPSQKAKKPRTPTVRKARVPKQTVSKIQVIKPKKVANSAAKSKAPKAADARKKKASVQRNGDNVPDEHDSELYGAVLDSQVALDTVVADWITLYEESAEEAMLKLTNFLLRSCGCAHSITAQEFQDEDNMVETLENLLLRYKENTTNFDYPIVSKAKEFKKFKKNLLEFYTRLVQKAQSSSLLDGVLMETLLSWTNSLSSTTFRPVRHTATVVALNIVTSLSEIASELQEELNVTNRQLATSQKQKAAQAKLKQLEKKAAETQRRKTDVFKWIENIFDSVFVLRCRDVDPLVRADCIKELGLWMTTNADHFLTTSYIRYLGWALSDTTSSVRLESLKVLAKLYESDIQASALRQFTTRCTERFIEMAVGEPDTFARLGAIRVATLVHKHGHLEEEDQVKLSGLIFGANAKVRKSLAKFVKARVWEDEYEGRMAACEVLVSSSQDSDAAVRKDWIELKSLVSFLIKVGKAEDAQREESEEMGSSLIDETKVGRIALAVEALWSEMDVLKNWTSIAEYLAQDHTIAPASSSRSQNKPATLEDCYHLEEEQENVLLEIFVACLQLTLHPPAVPGFQKDKAKLKTQLDDLANEVGRYVVNVIPQLFLKYGVDSSRIRSVLAIPQLIPLNVYLDMRMLSAYEELVDEVIKVFKKHTDPSVLHAAALTLRTMQNYEILRTSHEAKIDTLGASMIDSFLALSKVSEESEGSLDEETLQEMALCLRRLEHLVKCTDLTSKKGLSVEQDPFDALLKVVERHRSVQGQDVELLISGLSIAFLWISWICRGYCSKYGQNADWLESDAKEVLHKQDQFIKLLTNLATMNSHQVDIRARRKAFQVLGDAYWLFGSDMFHSSKGPNRHRLYLSCPESTQAECETFVRSEIGLWSEKVDAKKSGLREARKARKEKDAKGNEESDLDDDQADEEITWDVHALNDEKEAASLIEQEEKHEMFGTVFSFMRQIILKDFGMEHATAVIAHYGRFGAEFDEGVKRVVNSIRTQTTESPFKPVRDQKAGLFMQVCLDSLKEAFAIFMEGHVHSSGQALQLSKVLTTAIRPPGFMQSTRTGIDTRLIWDLQRQGLVFVLQSIGRFTSLHEDKKKAKMIKFLDVLVQMLFGVQANAAQVQEIQNLIETECENRELIVTDNKIWAPLRTYQSKLEKLQLKATTEQAVAVKKAAAAVAQAEARGGEDATEDVEMLGVQATSVDTFSGPVEDAQAQPSEAMKGKKRLAALDESEDEDRMGEASRESASKSSSRQGSVSRESEDGVSEASFQTLTTTKDTKRIRVA